MILQMKTTMTGAAESKIKYPCDLHLHSLASDGLLAPAALVDFCQKEELSFLALTDHDTFSGLKEAALAAQKNGQHFLYGVELSCELVRSGKNPLKVHILGYFPTFPVGELAQKLDELLAMRLDRAREMADRLASIGCPIDIEAILAARRGGHIGRPHLAAALVAGGYATGVDEAFKRYLGDGKPAYVPYEKPLDAYMAIELIAAARGKAVIAHPGEYGQEAIDDDLPKLKAAGLFGIECTHPSNAKKVEKHYRALCRELDLLPTGGSDFHGTARHGALPGSFGASAEIFAKLAGEDG